MAAAGLPRWWSQDQAVLHQPEVKAKTYDTDAGRAEPIDSSVPSNWWRRESGVQPQQLAAAAAMLQNTEPSTPNVPTVVVVVKEQVVAEAEAEEAEEYNSFNYWKRPVEFVASPAEPPATAAAIGTAAPTASTAAPAASTAAPAIVTTAGLPMWYKRQSSALLDINAATKTGASTHVTPTLPSQNVGAESTAPALSPVERLKEWQKLAKDSLSDFSCVAPRSNKSYGCLQSRRAVVP